MASTRTRLTVISPEVIAHVMEHPARGVRWPVRELASRLGCSPSLLGHMRTGERRQIDAELAHTFAEAVGCHVANLFMVGVSAESDTRGSSAA